MKITDLDKFVKFFNKMSVSFEQYHPFRDPERGTNLDVGACSFKFDTAGKYLGVTDDGDIEYVRLRLDKRA